MSETQRLRKTGTEGRERKKKATTYDDQEVVMGKANEGERERDSQSSLVPGTVRYLID
jgi:hypothetical protein